MFAGRAHADPSLTSVTPAAISGAGVAQVPGFEAVPLENASALRPFFAALSNAEKRQVRVAFYGDSHTAPDLITGRLRHGLQSQFGEAGIGFVTAAKPWAYHRHSLVEYVESSGFTGVRVDRRTRSGVFGLFGAALKAPAKTRAVARLRTQGYAGQTGHVSQLELYYLKQPRGGRVQVSLDGKRVAVVSTKATSSEAGYLRFDATEGAHQIELRTLGDGPVTLFGLTLEREGPGVIVDTLGIPGARAKLHSIWDEALYREHLERRKPDLVVLAYGTNEAGDPDLSVAEYEASVRKVIQRVQGYLPEASCLLVGPTDRPERQADGSWGARAQLYGIIAVQRRLARELGCAFFDVAEAMGGPLSIMKLAASDPPYAKRDYVHLTMRGYNELGDALHESLLRAYRAERAE